MDENDPIVNLIEEFLEDKRENEEDKLFEKDIFGKIFPQDRQELEKKDYIKNGKVYNEFSLQHELGEFLKKKFKDDPKYSRFNNFKVQYERNVEDFGGNKKEFVKKEMDVVIFEKFEKESEKYAIELKFPPNGCTTTRMPHLLEDVQFMEAVRELGFKTYCLTLVPNNKNGDAFRINEEPKRKKSNKETKEEKEFFKFFRGESGNDPIEPIKNWVVEKKNKKGVITRYPIAGEYQIKWKHKTNYCFYYLLPIPDLKKE